MELVENYIFESIAAEHQGSRTYTRTYELAREEKLASLMQASCSDTVKDMISQNV